MPQRDIAQAVHLSQASVHRVIARARALGMDHESIEEIVLQRFIGDLNSERMLEKLAQVEHWVPRIVDPVDGVLAEDTQAELERLHEDGFLSEGELDQALDAHG